MASLVTGLWHNVSSAVRKLPKTAYQALPSSNASQASDRFTASASNTMPQKTSSGFLTKLWQKFSSEWQRFRFWLLKRPSNALPHNPQTTGGWWQGLALGSLVTGSLVGLIYKTGFTDLAKRLERSVAPVPSPKGNVSWATLGVVSAAVLGITAWFGPKFAKRIRGKVEDSALNAVTRRLPNWTRYVFSLKTTPQVQTEKYMDEKNSCFQTPFSQHCGVLKKLRIAPKSDTAKQALYQKLRQEFIAQVANKPSEDFNSLNKTLQQWHVFLEEKAKSQLPQQLPRLLFDYVHTEGQAFDMHFAKFASVMQFSSKSLPEQRKAYQSRFNDYLKKLPLQDVLDSQSVLQHWQTFLIQDELDARAVQIQKSTSDLKAKLQPGTQMAILNTADCKKWQVIADRESIRLRNIEEQHLAKITQLAQEAQNLPNFPKIERQASRARDLVEQANTQLRNLQTKINNTE
jgi:hypothetical protein